MKIAKNIKFYIGEDYVNTTPKPLSSSKFFPDWFKRLPPLTEGNIQSATVKKCLPFVEASSAGYIIPFPCDVFVAASNNELRLDFPRGMDAELGFGIDSHNVSQIAGYPLESKPYGDMPLKWVNPWIVETPKGYSCLFTSPLNHMETRFRLIDGVVDTDDYYNNVNLPFVWTGGDGDFLIKAGTPLVQVIPFKRDAFKSSILPMDKNRRNTVRNAIGTNFLDVYRNKFWNKAKRKG